MSAKNETNGQPRRVAATVVRLPLPQTARPSPLPRAIELPVARWRAGIRARPGLNYRLPEQAADAQVAVEGRDLVLRFSDGRTLLLQQLVTAEMMTDPPILRLGARAVLASTVALVALMQSRPQTLENLIDLAEVSFAFHGPSACAAAAALVCSGSASDWPRAEPVARWTILRSHPLG